MAEHPNMARMYEMRDLWNRGDLQGFLDGCADDIVVRVGGNNRLSGTYEGKQAYARYLGTLAQIPTEVTFEDLLAGDHHAAAVINARSTDADGVTMDFKMAMAFRLDDNGKWKESWYLPADQEAWDRLWS